MNQTPEPGFTGIQYLRGLAAMMVVYHHVPASLRGEALIGNLGARGVDIFFVISGFIMAYSTRHFIGTPDEVRRFLFKRLIRIVPLYWVALTYVALPMLLNRGPNTDLLLDYLFIPHYSERYPGEILPLLVPGWSLNYEMFFYALFAGAILLGRLKLVCVASLLLAIYLLGRLLDTDLAPLRFYASGDAIKFALGIGIYALHRRLPRQPLPLWLGGLVAFAGLFVLATGSAYGTLAYGPAAATIVYVGVVGLRALSSSTLGILGDASYSIYLFHGPASALSAGMLNAAGVVEGHWSVTPCYLATGALVGIILHRVLERPLMRMLTSRFDPRPVSAVSMR